MGGLKAERLFRQVRNTVTILTGQQSIPTSPKPWLHCSFGVKIESSSSTLRGVTARSASSPTPSTNELHLEIRRWSFPRNENSGRAEGPNPGGALEQLDTTTKPRWTRRHSGGRRTWRRRPTRKTYQIILCI